ncbi:MAG: glutamate racemase [Candidatus Omnitrophica bacterium CG11_big_fil_rev_8_21_14_0_20_64_10]|nr:MAG: glutamate racemase [Candidatus Omnitrophica bacterium CG11_big_fil_rev_8_21_14_0_20_64_10]
MSRKASRPAARPIGLFDSGIGGLTVVRALLKLLPRESLVYLGDTARVPYGNKSRETVIRFSTENTLFLLRHRVKLVIVACHTASSFALPLLERQFKQPLLGVVAPGVAAALAATRSGRVGVIGTAATVGSGAYVRGIRRKRPGIKVFQAACPLFVPLVEEGRLNGPVTERVAREYLAPLKRARVDTLILGCTHYPLLKGVIARVMGRGVRLIDSAEAAARQAQALLEGEGLLVAGSGRPRHRFFATDAPDHFKRFSARFLGRPARQVSRA